MLYLLFFFGAMDDSGGHDPPSASAADQANNAALAAANPDTQANFNVSVANELSEQKQQFNDISTAIVNINTSLQALIQQQQNAAAAAAAAAASAPPVSPFATSATSTLSSPPTISIPNGISFDKYTASIDDAPVFIAKLKAFFLIQNISLDDDRILGLLLLVLKGVSLRWFHSCQNSPKKFNSFDDFEKAFLNEHTKDNARAIRNQQAYNNISQRPDETLADYGNRFTTALMDLGDAGHLPLSQLLHKFTHGLSSSLPAREQLVMKAAILGNQYGNDASSLHDIIEELARDSSSFDFFNSPSHKVKGKQPMPPPTTSYGSMFSPLGNPPIAASPMEVGAVSSPSRPSGSRSYTSAVASSPASSSQQPAPRSAKAEKKFLNPAIAEIQKAGIVTLEQLRSGIKFEKLTPEHQKLLDRLAVCRKCRSGFHSSKDCPHSQEVDTLCKQLRAEQKKQTAAASGGR